MTLTFDPVAYGRLLAEVTPMVIETEAEYHRALSRAEQLTFAQDRTPEQRSLYKLLVLLIEAYETEHYPIEKSTPHEILRHMMESSGTRQSDLVGVIGSSGVVSEVVNGQRSISKAQAKALGDYFKVLILELLAVAHPQNSLAKAKQSQHEPYLQQ
jgi:HTH-type transcriptional regulator / antitoxin HigA